MDIGKQIMSLRKQRGITQEVLAAEMGVTVGAISKWENGNTLPDIIMICALADFFKFSTDELLGRTSRSVCFFNTTDFSVSKRMGYGCGGVE